jgi:hypothetical protein
VYKNVKVKYERETLKADPYRSVPAVALILVAQTAEGKRAEI